MGADLPRRAEEFVDVTLAVADANATYRVTEGLRGLPEIVQPTNAFFLFRLESVSG